MRTKRVLRNSVFSIVAQIVVLLASFVVRTAIIRFLGNDYVSVNGLFTNILSLLSLVELGFGTAIVASMYKPVAENDTARISSLMRLYAQAYRFAGIAVAVIGLALLPFMDYIITEKPDVPELTLIYLLFLANSVVSYFFAYKASIFSANQQEYTIIGVRRTMDIITTVAKILVLFLTRNFVLMLVLQIALTLLTNIILARKAEKAYPYLKEKNVPPLPPEERKTIFKNVKALMISRINEAVLNGTDAVIISTFIGLSFVGKYSNYMMIVSMVAAMIARVFNSITSSVGNINVTESKGKMTRIFDVLNLVSFWLHAVLAVCFFFVLTPFIRLWAGDSYAMDNLFVLSVVLNFYVTGLIEVPLLYRRAMGLFRFGQWMPALTVVLNISLSIALAFPFGVAGVVFATSISKVLTYGWYYPYLILRKNLDNSMKSYILKTSLNILLTLASGLLAALAVRFLDVSSWIGLIVCGGIAFVIPNVVFLAVYAKSSEFSYIMTVIRSVVKRKKN